MVFVEFWDQPIATWDSGLDWDVNYGPSPGDVAPYLALVTSEHRDRPKFIAALTACLKGFVDTNVFMLALTQAYDLDYATGPRLDAVGAWVGASRTLSTPLTGVYFSFDTAGLGFDEGTWKGPFDPSTALVVLPDDAYRTLIRAKIVANQWDGTVAGAYAAYAILFEGKPYSVLIQDYNNMHMLLALVGPAPDAVTLALFTGGYLDLKPVGVRIDAYAQQSVPDTPYFGFDVQNSSIAGFDTGAFAALSPGR